MKNYLKISIIILIFSSFFFSCTPNNVAEGDITPEQTEEQAVDGRTQVREKPTD